MIGVIELVGFGAELRKVIEWILDIMQLVMYISLMLEDWRYAWWVEA
uniref:Uncharacterized protein n=1 Tax=Rhizophora mucronata TaxID=61149 RepID=A0A2P2IJG1_RHIMU